MSNECDHCGSEDTRPVNFGLWKCVECGEFFEADGDGDDRIEQFDRRRRKTRWDDDDS